MKEQTKKKFVQTAGSDRTGEGKLTVADAIKAWNKKFPKAPVTKQTIRNWALKYGFGEKNTFLPRSIWIIDAVKFDEFLKNPESFLINKKKEKE